MADSAPKRPPHPDWLSEELAVPCVIAVIGLLLFLMCSWIR